MISRQEWKMPRERSTAGPGSQPDEEELGDDDAPDWQRTRRVGGSLFHKWGAAYRKEWFVILRLEWTGSRRRVTNVDDGVDQEDTGNARRRLEELLRGGNNFVFNEFLYLGAWASLEICECFVSCSVLCICQRNGLLISATIC